VARVLYLVHGLPPEEYTGTPLVALGYATGMARRGWDVGVVYPSSRFERATEEGIESEPGIHRFPVRPAERNGLLWSIEQAVREPSLPTQESADFDAIVDQFRPDVVHVVDNVSLPLGWPERAVARGLPVVRTVSAAEDLCGLIAPVSPCSQAVGYCEAPITPEHCARCVASVFADRWGHTGHGEPDTAPGISGPLSEALLAGRSARLRKALEAKRERAEHQFRHVFSVALFATPAWHRFFEATLPLDPGRARVLPMGIDVSRWPTERRRRSRPDGSPVVLVWATTLDHVRGVADVVQAFSTPALTTRRDYRLRILGGGDAALVEPLLRSNPNVELVGRYDAEDLPAHLLQADAGLSTSLFETFHRVTREYFLAGLPVIANPTFGTADILRHEENALLYRHDQPGSLQAAVVRLLDDPALEVGLAEGASETPVRSVDDELDELATIYEEVLRRR